jgi:hypothetical protein
MSPAQFHPSEKSMLPSSLMKEPHTPTNVPNSSSVTNSSATKTTATNNYLSLGVILGVHLSSQLICSILQSSNAKAADTWNLERHDEGQPI